MGRAYAKCKRNDHHHRPEPGAGKTRGKRHRHRNSERSANVQVKAAGTESVTRKCADKKVQAPPYTQDARMDTEPKDTVIAKGTDNRAHAHTQQKDTGTVIGTGPGNRIR